MNDTNQSKLCIVVGKNGKFSKAFNDIKLPHLNLSNVWTENFDSYFAEKILTNPIYNDQRIELIWSSGKAKANSDKSVCDDDYQKLSKFVNIIGKYANNSPRISFLSSGGTVYGRNAGISNEMSKLNPDTYYAEMKIKSEEMLNSYCHKSGLGLSFFRIANAFSKLNLTASKGLIETLEECFAHNSLFTLSVFGDSKKQYGTYADYAKTILQFLINTEREKEIQSTTNVFSPHVYSVNSIINIMENHFDKKLLIKINETACEETVILENKAIINFGIGVWATLENHLEKCYPRS